MRCIVQWFHCQGCVEALIVYFIGQRVFKEVGMLCKVGQYSKMHSIYSRQFLLYTHGYLSYFSVFNAYLRVTYCQYHADDMVVISLITEYTYDDIHDDCVLAKYFWKLENQTFYYRMHSKIVLSSSPHIGGRNSNKMTK